MSVNRPVRSINNSVNLYQQNNFFSFEKIMFHLDGSYPTAQVEYLNHMLRPAFSAWYINYLEDMNC